MYLGQINQAGIVIKTIPRSWVQPKPKTAPGKKTYKNREGISLQLVALSFRPILDARHSKNLLHQENIKAGQPVRSTCFTHHFHDPYSCLSNYEMFSLNNTDRNRIICGNETMLI